MHPQAPTDGATRRTGTYRLISRLDPAGGGSQPVPERRFVARSADGERTVLLSAPHEGTDPERFLVEARAAQGHGGRSLMPVTEVSPSSAAPWYATPYLPVLPLPLALAVHGGPLPEHTVRALGTVLADTLAALHAAGVTHAGLSPAAVLIAADGPRLGCFGALRAAGPDGEPRTGRPGVEPGSLAPEAAAGGRPRPPGDVHGLGAVLAYAAIGHTVPDRAELPAWLGSSVSRCLTRDAAARPSPAELSAALRPGSSAPVATVLDSSSSLLGPGWLPGRLIAALARQSAQVLAAGGALPDPTRNR